LSTVTEQSYRLPCFMKLKNNTYLLGILETKQYWRTGMSLSRKTTLYGHIDTYEINENLQVNFEEIREFLLYCQQTCGEACS